MNSSHNKKHYTPPELEVFEYVVEKGFQETETRGITSGSQDEWSEVHYNYQNDRTGETQTGEWTDDFDW